MSNSLQSPGLWPTRLLRPWDFPGKNTAASCHSLLQGVILTQGLNPGLPHWQVDSWPSEPPGKYYFVCKLKKWKRKYWSIPNLNTMLRVEFESFNGLFTEFPSSLFSLVPKSCPAVCDPMECSTPGFPVNHQLPELTQTHVHRVGDAIQPSVGRFSSCLQSFPASKTFLVSQFFASGGQSIGVSALASVLPMNIQDWFPLGLTAFISLQFKGLKSLLQQHSSKASILWC